MMSDDVQSFAKKYTDVLNVLRIRSKSVYVCRDYNIDLLKTDSNNDYCSFYENVLSSSFAQKILFLQGCVTLRARSLTMCTQT